MTEPTITPECVKVSGSRIRYDRLKAWLQGNGERLARTVLEEDDILSRLNLAVRQPSSGGCFAQTSEWFAEGISDSPTYVLGDTHGDIDSLIAILDNILDRTGEGKDPVVLLLGDVLDRNAESCALECALILSVLQRALPEEFESFNRICLGIVKGDHDVALGYAEPYAPETRFTSVVRPADFCEWLNGRLEGGGGEPKTLIGRAWVRLMGICPAAVFHGPTGTLLAHGGIARCDLQARFVAGEADVFQSPAAAQDFSWCRMVDAKKKLLNRNSKTCSIGGEEFDAFCKLALPEPSDGEVQMTMVRRFVFGHQHPSAGFEQYVKWYDGYEVLCLSSFRDDGALFGPTIPHFCQLPQTQEGLAGVRVYRLELAFDDDSTAQVSDDTVK